MADETLEGGGLMSVLDRATHEELDNIVTALNKGWDVFITWDDRYKPIRDDLTKNPGFIAEYLCRAGGHTLANRVRGVGVAYSEIVGDACRGVGLTLPKNGQNVVALETLLLQELLERALKGLSESERDELEKQIRETAGRDASLTDILTGGAQFALLLPMVFAALAKTTIARGFLAAGALVANRFALSFLGPAGLVIGTVWMANDLAGPSLRATIPAVTCVALLRQRMMWCDAQ